jgi:hypothetical protein
MSNGWKYLRLEWFDLWLRPAPDIPDKIVPLVHSSCRLTFLLGQVGMDVMFGGGIALFENFVIRHWLY